MFEIPARCSLMGHVTLLDGGNISVVNATTPFPIGSEAPPWCTAEPDPPSSRALFKKGKIIGIRCGEPPPLSRLLLPCKEEREQEHYCNDDPELPEHGQQGHPILGIKPELGILCRVPCDEDRAAVALTHLCPGTEGADEPVPDIERGGKDDLHRVRLGKRGQEMVIPDRSGIVNGIIPFRKGDGEPVRTVVTAGIAGTIARERDVAYLDRNSLSQETRL